MALFIPAVFNLNRTIRIKDDKKVLTGNIIFEYVPKKKGGFSKKLFPYFL